jgi:3-oxoacyl-[acyl-carrier-protein] synthase III
MTESNMPPRATIKAIATHFPERVLTNEELVAQFGEWTAEMILQKTGISERRIAAEDETASDLGVAAAEKLFAGSAIARQEIDFLLFCTQSPDYFLPATACLMQDRLELPTTCGALDFNQGCSGFVYGLSMAKSLIEARVARNVLLVTAETYSKFIHPRDRSVRTIFGDAAAATLVSAVESDRELIGPFVFGTDGRGGGNLIVPTGGTRRPRTAETAVAAEAEGGNWRSADNLYMNGGAIFTFTLNAVPAAVEQLLVASGRTVDQIDYFFFHQANTFMLEKLRSKMKLPKERFWMNMESCANTVSSTIPIALEQARASGAVSPGDTVMLVGFGVGLSWAASLMTVQ